MVNEASDTAAARVFNPWIMVVSVGVGSPDCDRCPGDVDAIAWFGRRASKVKRALQVIRDSGPVPSELTLKIGEIIMPSTACIDSTVESTGRVGASTMRCGR
jgi:hypothetical protein